MCGGRRKQPGTNCYKLLGGTPYYMTKTRTRVNNTFLKALSELYTYSKIVQVTSRSAPITVTLA